MRTFNFEFEELPLLIDADGFEAALINGSAAISYDGQGGWNTDSISLDGHKHQDRVWKRRPVALPKNSPLYSLIIAALEGPWRETVQNAVNEQIDQDRENEAGAEADRRHDERKMAVM